MNAKHNGDNSEKGLFTCGTIIAITIVITVIAVIGNLVVNGRKGASEMFFNEDNDVIGELRGGFILLAIVGVLYFILKARK